MKWVCQNNLGSLEDVETIERACGKHGYDFLGLKVIPFSDELPDVPVDESVVFYGAVRWINKIYQSNKWPNAIFINDNFNYEVMAENWGEKILNTDYQVTTIEQMSGVAENDYYFVRPLEDNKAFSGCILNVREITDWYNKLATDRLDILTMPIIIAKPKVVTHEWRLFMVDGSVVGSTLYRRYGVLHTKEPVPPEVIAHAEELCKEWEPHKVFALDLCREQDEDEFKVLEVGAFNSAGFYAANIEDIVVAVSDYVEDKHSLRNYVPKHRVWPEGRPAPEGIGYAPQKKETS